MSDEPTAYPFGRFSDEVPPDGSGERRSDRWVFVLGAVVLAVAGLTWMSQVPDIHWPRVFGVLMALGLGLWVGICLARRQEWHVRAYCLAAGVGGACLAWWFVPTSAGLSLYAAKQEYERQAAELESL